MALDPTDPPLLALVRRHKRHLWVGNNPPFDFDSVFLPGSTNYRTSAGHHRAYDVVWSFEPDVAMLPPESVTLYLDELVRCLGADGRLVVRYHEHAKFTVVQLKRFLGRHPFLDVEVEHEKVRQADGWVTVFRVRRQHLAEYASADWTLAILTQGKKVANVVAFLQSVRDQDPDRRHELIVCGPAHPAYEPFGVRVHAKEYSAEFGDICTKKNDLAHLATHPNLMLVHDRYRLDPGFFAGFDRYGHDFDFLTVPQSYDTGEEFPSYCTGSKKRHTFAWTPPIALTDYSRVYPQHYINGGLLVVKTHTLRALRLNDLLFWNQAEDCEFTRWLQDHSLPPRINLFSRATVMGLTPAYSQFFTPERADDSEEDPPPPAARPAAPAPPRPGLADRVRHALHLRFRKIAAVTVAVMLAAQAAILYLLLTGGHR